MHRRSLEQHRFDAILLPWNYTMSKNPSYRAEFLDIREYCRTHQIAVQTIKSIAKGPVHEGERPRDVWYEPLEDQDAIDAAVWWVLAHPELFINMVGDIDLMPRVVDAAERFSGEAPTSERMEELARRTGQTPLFVE
jgi:hypothetical protein